MEQDQNKGKHIWGMHTEASPGIWDQQQRPIPHTPRSREQHVIKSS